MSTVTGSSIIKYGADDSFVLLGACGRLNYISPFDYQDETQDPVTNTYLTMSEVDAKLTNYVNTAKNQSINGTKIFSANVNATGFVKKGKDDTSVLLTGGVDALLSMLRGMQMEYITNLTVYLHSSNVYNDEALLDAACLSEFPELYAYVHEREPKPIVDRIANQIIVGPYFLQD
ncbi:MAG: hypothetical protein EZS28_033907 [Streblomastix strix]|uniref:Uncharacterized protein n=1 Tax=Streblomastix strix TaxID=222440 RepID=A0A5J4UIC2_9EUKA|nr:MAG: hypothetical protein EZS28_033907 [Streblomastix strix]